MLRGGSQVRKNAKALTKTWFLKGHCGRHGDTCNSSICPVFGKERQEDWSSRPALATQQGVYGQSTLYESLSQKRKKGGGGIRVDL